ncbi:MULTISPECIES: hypothetical protein [Mesorhizobium]|uniref:Uncharacterized protein n=2 Tax=Mesorhizobium TaxID=68287 RepID=A0ABN8KB12_9HYPH|nr:MULTISPECIES: hypothetical protein [Mesorhizobium]CAH2395163.1 hypothetical protein MES5069_100026 [Mesorhizobium escarrei]CAH2405840.1 hypothetical protein MES4922_400006 [Mesorhizobium ventifaucium]
MTSLAGNRMKMNGFPAIYNIEADPREEVNVVGTAAWVIGPYLRIIGDYQKTLAHTQAQRQNEGRGEEQGATSSQLIR